MSWRILLFTAFFLAGCQGVADNTSGYGLGREATAQEIAAWDIDVTPDGHGLLAGSGSVSQGAAVYTQKCFACHGQEGVGGVNDRLVLAYVPGVVYAEGTTPKTIGNYWPYATTLYDYIYRAMPHTEPGSLTAAEVYSLTAYLLNRNGIIDDNAVMNADTLPQVTMPARELFYFSDEVN